MPDDPAMPEELGEPASMVNGLPSGKASIDPNATVVIQRPAPAIFHERPGDFIGPYQLIELLQRIAKARKAL